MQNHAAPLLADDNFPRPRRHCHFDDLYQRLQDRQRRSDQAQPYAIALPKSMRPRHEPKSGVGGGPENDYDQLVDDSKNFHNYSRNLHVVKKGHSGTGLGRSRLASEAVL